MVMCYDHTPADDVLLDEVTVLLLLLPYTAVTLTVQLLPALRPGNGVGSGCSSQQCLMMIYIAQSYTTTDKSKR